jgi:hypothetical protein
MKNKRIAVLLVMLAACFAVTGTVCAAGDETTRPWDIPFIGTLQVPARMEIIELKDVLAEAIKFEQKQQAAKQKVLPLNKDKAPAKKQLTLEDLDKFSKTSNFGLYEFAVKAEGTYSTAFAFAFKVPGKMTLDMHAFFNKLRDATTQQEEELRSTVMQGLELAYAKEPDMRDILAFEILEFYPFDRLESGDAEIVGVGGSVAFRTFKLICPVAGKVFFIRKNDELYVFGIVNSGVDRKRWAEIGTNMVSDIQWHNPKK